MIRGVLIETKTLNLLLLGFINSFIIFIFSLVFHILKNPIKYKTILPFLIFFLIIEFLIIIKLIIDLLKIRKKLLDYKKSLKLEVAKNFAEYLVVIYEIDKIIKNFGNRLPVDNNKYYTFFNNLDLIDNTINELISKENIFDVFEKLNKVIDDTFSNNYLFLQYFEEILKKIDELIKELEKYNNKLYLNIITTISDTILITRDIEDFINKKFNNTLKSNVIQVENIKKYHEENSDITKNILNDFRAQYSKSTLFNIKYKEELPVFFEHLDLIVKTLSNSINEYQNSFKEILSLVGNINDIAEKIRIISLNLSIEASKTSNKSFIVIGKELQNLSKNSQDFSKIVQDSLNNSLMMIDKLRNENLEKLKSLEDYILTFKKLIEEYDQLSKETDKKLNILIDIFNKNQESNLHCIMNIYNEAQKFSILEEEYKHKSIFTEKIFKCIYDKTNEIIDEKFIKRESFEKSKDNLKYLLKSLKEILTTKDEHEFLDNLYKKYNIENETEKISHTDQDIILF